MNDETLEIETDALEASVDEILEDASQSDADLSLVDTQSEISDIEAEETSLLAEENDSLDKEVDLGEMDLKGEIDALRRELQELGKKKTEFLSEIKEFSEIFGVAALAEIPESVWQSAADGTPLAAAYALYERKLANQRELAERVNKKNASLSAGAIKGVSESGYYSPEEVRGMSAKEVKKNYNRIIESMKKWN